MKCIICDKILKSDIGTYLYDDENYCSQECCLELFEVIEQ